MQETADIVALRVANPELFDADPVGGLRAVENELAKCQSRTRALGILRRSYKTRLNRSPLAQVIKEAKDNALFGAADHHDTIAPQKVTVHHEPKMTTSIEMDELFAELSAELATHNPAR